MRKTIEEYRPAKEILKSNFIPPETIAKRRKITYGKKALKHFYETVPSVKILQWLRDNNCVLLAGPPKPMSLLRLHYRRKNCKYFCGCHRNFHKGDWYAEERIIFSREEKVDSNWIMLRKEVIPDTINKSWSRQLEYIPSDEYVPNVAELIWSVTTLKEVRHIILLSSFYTLTSTLSSHRIHDQHVSVGYSKCDRKYIINYGRISDCPLTDTGLISAKKMKFLGKN